jgi:hypothetical protein
MVHAALSTMFFLLPLDLVVLRGLPSADAAAGFGSNASLTIGEIGLMKLLGLSYAVLAAPLAASVSRMLTRRTRGSPPALTK